MAAGVTPHADYFDGTTSRKRTVELLLADRLQIITDGRVVTTWSYDEIRRADGPPGVLRLRALSAPPLARLEIADADLAAACVARCSQLGASSGWQGIGRVFLLGLAATVSVALMILFGLPALADRIAPLIPLSLERRIGDIAEKQVTALSDGKACDASDGTAALAELVAKVRTAAEVAPAGAPIVVASPVANAFALPGGRVVIFNGLIAAADNPDELAGVLGHEFGHLKHRDGMRNLIHAGGLSFLAGMMYGDVTCGSTLVVASRTLVNASYSREVEDEADAYSIATMQRLRRSPQAMGDLLTRITAKQGGEAVSWLSSHPLTKDRLDRMRAATSRADGPPLLSPEQWTALKAICTTASKT